MHSILNNIGVTNNRKQSASKLKEHMIETYRQIHITQFYINHVSQMKMAIIN